MEPNFDPPRLRFHNRSAQPYYSPQVLKHNGYGNNPQVSQTRRLRRVVSSEDIRQRQPSNTSAPQIQQRVSRRSKPSRGRRVSSPPLFNASLPGPPDVSIISRLSSPPPNRPHEERQNRSATHYQRSTARRCYDDVKKSIQRLIPSPPIPRPSNGEASNYLQVPTQSSSLVRVPPPRIANPPQPRQLTLDEHSLVRPRITHSPYPRADTEYLFPPNGTARYPQRDDARREIWKSKSISSPKIRTLTYLRGRPWFRKSTISTTPTDSSFRSSMAVSTGTLGENAYQYKALQDSEFRLVRILPERKTMIKCEIISASLEFPPPYIAISYAWGDAGNTRKIQLDGSLIPIAISVYGALESLRQKSESVFVWADALCIDQQNKEERTQQVRLMPRIYSEAGSVAVWLGPEEDDSALAVKFLQEVVNRANSSEKFSSLISSQVGQRGLVAVVSLFERDYWRRLWVVQEIFNARSITVYCGTTTLPWSVYKHASQAFSEYRDVLDRYFPTSQRDGWRHTPSPIQFSHSQVLVYQGPGSLPDLRTYLRHGPNSVLEVLRACRRKLTSDPKDKLFGILGVLPEEARQEFQADYSLSVKDVYTEVVDYLLKTTESLHVICDAIHFPVHTNSANLPSYVPDWSHIPQTAAMGHKYSFSAARETKAKCRFLDERLNKLEISAIYLDTISIHGVAVGTLCTLADYLMGFLHWRALLLFSLQDNKDKSKHITIQDDFCRTLSLGQIPWGYDRPNQWLTVCYNVFATLLHERLPHLAVDQELREYAYSKVDVKSEARREFVQKHFGDRMMGRCFCLTEDYWVGMGSGLMLPGDIVVVPLGCSTPILLRLEGARGEYRFVGDVYINGYMHGRAVDEWKDGKREMRKYVLH